MEEIHIIMSNEDRNFIAKKLLREASWMEREFHKDPTDLVRLAELFEKAPSEEMERQQKRILELEEVLLDSDKIFVREIGRQQTRIQELEAKEGYLESANKEIYQLRMRTLELEEHLVDTEKTHTYEHREVGRIHRELVDLVGAVALLGEEMGDRAGVLEE